MTTSIRLEGLPFKEGCNPTQHQRAICYFYDSRCSDEAKDIYSIEWYERTARYNKDAQSSPATLTSWSDIKTMDFASFFNAHPIAGFKLWKVLEASYQLDRVACAGEMEDVKCWEQIPPFSYFESEEVEKMWQDCVSRRQDDIAHGVLSGGAFVMLSYELLRRLQVLEDTRKDIHEHFRVNLGGPLASKMSTAIEKAVRRRRKMIEGGLYL